MTRSTEEDSLEDGPLISADALHSAIRREFQTIPTPCPAGLLSLLHVLHVVLSICVALLCVLEFGQKDVCIKILGEVNGDSAIVFGKVFLWFLMLLYSCWMQHHHSQARSRGYLRFYRQTRRLKQLPFVIHSGGNVLLLGLMAMKLPQIYHISILLIILGLELLMTLPLLIIYMGIPDTHSLQITLDTNTLPAPSCSPSGFASQHSPCPFETRQHDNQPFSSVSILR